MLASTDYLPESRLGSAGVTMLDPSDLEIWRRNRGEEPETKNWRNRLVQALSAATWQEPRQTFSYSRSGEGTALWTLADYSIQNDSMQSLLESAPSDVGTHLGQFLVLPDIVGIARLYMLEEMYSLRDATAVRRFLQTYPHVVKVLLDAYPYLLKHFGPDSQVTLEVVSDPEVADWDQLFAYICTPLPVNEALARLHKLDEEWFLDQLDRIDDLFNFNLKCL